MDVQKCARVCVRAPHLACAGVVEERNSVAAFAGFRQGLAGTPTSDAQTIFFPSKSRRSPPASSAKRETHPNGRGSGGKKERRRRRRRRTVPSPSAAAGIRVTQHVRGSIDRRQVSRPPPREQPWRFSQFPLFVFVFERPSRRLGATHGLRVCIEVCGRSGGLGPSGAGSDLTP